MNSETVYTFDGTFEGALTAIFEAYATKPMPWAILPTGCQAINGTTYTAIQTDADKARRVVNGICRYMGKRTYDILWYAFLYGDEQCGDRIYRYVRLGMTVGEKIRKMIADERVAAVHLCARKVWEEADTLSRQVRFTELKGGIYYTAIHPEHTVLPILTPRVANQLRERPFFIKDCTHDMYAIWNKKNWNIL